MKHFFSFGLFFSLLINLMALDFKASKAVLFSDSDSAFDSASYQPDENGVYPVKLTWSKSGDSYKVFFYENESQNYKLLEETESDIVWDYNPALPGEKRLYKLCTYDSSGNLISSETDYGWGALTPETYLMTYTTMLDKTQKRLSLMNKKGVLEKLGSESIDGLLSGSLEYKTKIIGFSGLVTLTYSDYKDFDDWHFEGQIITKANMAANGSLSGTMTVTGMYPGLIIYDNAKLKSGVPGSGYYLVIQNNQSPAEVNYRFYMVLDS